MLHIYCEANSVADWLAAFVYDLQLDITILKMS
jgi:hypothetical protein